MKWQTISWIRFHNKFAAIRKSLEIDLSAQIAKLKESVFEELRSQKREFTSENWSFSHMFRREDIDKFEKLEKARFFLEEEELELRKLAETREKGEQELKACLIHVKDSLNRIPVSKTKRFLTQTLKEMRGEEKEKEVEELSEAEDALEKEESPNTLDFHMMKKDLLSKLDASSRKAFLNYLNQMGAKLMGSNKEIPRESVLKVDKVVETEDLEEDFGGLNNEEQEKKVEGFLSEIRKLEEKQRTLKRQLEEKKREFEEIEAEEGLQKEKAKKLNDEVLKLEGKLEDLEAREINRNVMEKKNTKTRKLFKFYCFRREEEKKVKL